MLATCPVCWQTAELAAQIRSVAVCASCGASFVIEADGSNRRATATDTTALTDAERQTLRKARGRTR
jgi:hypothetical protein